MEPPVLYTGECVGGPYDRQDVSVRYPRGFLCVDRAENLAWLYVRSDQVYAIKPDSQGNDARPLDETLRQAAVDDERYDVLAAPRQEEAIP